jgi:hypothetical protein
VHVFECGEEPELIFPDRAAEGSYVVLPRERLLGIGRGVFNGKAGVEGGGALVESCVAVKLVGAAPGGDDDGAGGGASGVGVFLGGADGELLDRIGREVLEKSSDVVVGVIAAVDGGRSFRRWRRR